MDLNFIFLIGSMYVLQFNRGLGSEKCGVIQLVTAWQVAMVFCYRERSFLDKSSECKYGWCSKEGGGGYGVCLWKYIRLGWSQFSRCIRFSIGHGTKVCFWHDWWCREGALKNAYPKLYSTAQDKEAAVADYLCWNVGSMNLCTGKLLSWELFMIGR